MKNRNKTKKRKNVPRANWEDETALTAQLRELRSNEIVKPHFEVEIRLAPNTAYVMSGASRIDWMHGVRKMRSAESSENPETERRAIIFRLNPFELPCVAGWVDFSVTQYSAIVFCMVGLGQPRCSPTCSFRRSSRGPGGRGTQPPSRTWRREYKAKCNIRRRTILEKNTTLWGLKLKRNKCGSCSRCWSPQTKKTLHLSRRTCRTSCWHHERKPNPLHPLALLSPLQHLALQTTSFP